MEVGYNYAWTFNRYGSTLGPRDYDIRDPALGLSDATPVFQDANLHPPAGSLARNLVILRDQLNIRKVRMFLIGNANNYGKQPIADLTASGKQFFFAPDQPNVRFFEHFRKMLEIFRDNQMQIVPSFIDFGAFYPKISGTAGGGRTSILTSQRQRFVETFYVPMLRIASGSPDLKQTVFAWEVVNEPFWNTLSIPLIAMPFTKRPHTTTKLADTTVEIMASFIQDCLNAAKAEGFKTTVGHRFFSDFSSKMPSGDMPQFHYYGRVSRIAGLVGANDPREIPTLASLANNEKTKDAFVGEFSTEPGGDRDRFDDEDPGEPWLECGGKDRERANSPFERLKVLARKGYKLAFLWPDRNDKEGGIGLQDELKLSAVAQTSVKRFTKGRFPNGIP